MIQMDITDVNGQKYQILLEDEDARELVYELIQKLMGDKELETLH